jgi:hypothetical protein
MTRTLPHGESAHHSYLLYGSTAFQSGAEVLVDSTREKDLYVQMRQLGSPENIQPNYSRVVRGSLYGGEAAPLKEWIGFNVALNEAIGHVSGFTMIDYDTIDAPDMSRAVKIIFAADPAVQSAALEKITEVRQRIPAELIRNVFVDAFTDAIVTISNRASDNARRPKQETFIDRASRLDKLGQTDSALDMLYDAVDHLMRRGSFDELNLTLRAQTAEELSVDISLGLLTSTLPARTRLPARAEFMKDVERVLRSRNEYEEGILSGL